MLFGRPKPLSDTELALLALFLKPRSLDTPQWQDIWSQALPSTYQRTIKRFRSDGLLAEANLAQRLDASMRVSDLKIVLRENALTVTGKKDALVQRLIENLPEMAEKCGQVSGIFVCSASGAEIAQAYKDHMAALRTHAEETSLAALMAGEVEEAVRAAHSYHTLRANASSSNNAHVVPFVGARQ